MSKIEWTEKTWNPIVGCSVVSPGCTNCYAMTMAARLERMGLERYRGLTKPSKAGPVWTGETRLVDEALTEPLRRRKPTMWFVNSMSDLFHESVPDAWIDRVFAVMALCPQHTFQVLTKRSARMRAYMTAPETFERVVEAAYAIHDQGHGGDKTAFDWPARNVWLGVSTEDQRRADERVPDLLATPAAVRFVSAEPLLGPIDFGRICLVPQVTGSPRAGIHINALSGCYFESGMRYIGEWDIAGPYPADAATLRLDQIIVGGENGPRPMHPAWARSIRDQCAAADVPFFFKQWGSFAPADACPSAWKSGEWGQKYNAYSFKDQTMHHVGKRLAGRLLDGVEHNGMPEVRA